MTYQKSWDQKIKSHADSTISIITIKFYLSNSYMNKTTFAMFLIPFLS